MIITQKAKPAATPARALGEKTKSSEDDRGFLVRGKLGCEVTELSSAFPGAGTVTLQRWGGGSVCLGER